MKRVVVVGAVVAIAFLAGRLSTEAPPTAVAQEGVVLCGDAGLIPLGNGDVNADLAIDVSDAVYILEWLFTGGPEIVPIECPLEPCWPCDSCCPGTDM